MATPEPVVVAATNAHQLALARTTTQLRTTLEEAFAEFMRLGLTDRGDIAAWIEGTLPAVRAAGVQASTLSDSYAALLAERPVIATNSAAYAHLAPLSSPFLRLWRSLGEGLTFDEAVAAAVDVAGRTATDAVTQAGRHATRRQMQAQGLSTPYRRVTDSDPCAWCAVVSTQLYLSAESASFGHGGSPDDCQCDVVPVTSDAAGRALDALMDERYEQLRADGTIEWASRDRQRRRVRDSGQQAATRRDQLVAELAAETDPQRRLRLMERAQAWDQQARSAHAAAATAAAN